MRTFIFLILLLLLAGLCDARIPDDWRDEEILPDLPEEFGGFLGLSRYKLENADQLTTPVGDVSLSPFGRPVDESQMYSIEAIEAQYTRPDPDPAFSDLTLGQTVRLGLERNFGLGNAARSLASSSSSRREATAEFIPFIDLTADATFRDSKADRTRRFDEEIHPELDEEDYNRQRKRETNIGNYEASLQQNLPWGGDFNITADRSRVKVVNRKFDDLRVDEDTGDIIDPINTTRDETYVTTVRMQYNQPLLRGAGWLVGTAALKQSRLSEMDAALVYNLRRRDVALSIIRLYYNVLRTANDIQVSLLALNEAQNLLEETKINYELGQIAESEISRAEIRFLQEKQTYVSRQQSYEAAVDDLLTEMGLPIQTRFSIGSTDGQLVDLRLAEIPPLEDGILEALNNRLELLQEDISVEQARLSFQDASNNILPDLDFTGNWIGFEEAEDDPSANDLEARREWDAGISFHVPLPNIGNRERRYRSRLALETAEQNREDNEREIIQEVKAAYRNLQSSETQSQILSRTVEQSRRSLMLENARFQSGLNSTSEVREAQDDLFDALTDYNQALLQMQVDISRVYSALGREVF